MAKSTEVTTRTRRREKKNISSGVAHVNATFNNTLVTITDAKVMPFLGPRLEVRDLVGRGNQPHMQRRLLLRMLGEKHRNTV